MNHSSKPTRTAMQWKDSDSSLWLETPQPFRFVPNIDYLARSTNECMFHVGSSEVIKLIDGQNGSALISVSCNDDRLLRIRFLDRQEEAASDEMLLEAVSNYVWEWFDLGRDLQPFYELAEREPLLSEVTRSFDGLRLMGIPDLFEAISWGIIGQQINLPFAYTLKRRLVEAYGSSHEHGGRTYWSFPRPERVAELAPGDLTSLQFTGKKAEYLLGVARLMADGALSKAGLLQHGDAKAAEAELLRIRGIGPWTANYVMMRCLRDPSAFPIADVGLHNALKHLLGRTEKPGLDEIRTLAEGWKGWEAYATFYLWRMLY